MCSSIIVSTRDVETIPTTATAPINSICNASSTARLPYSSSCSPLLDVKANSRIRFGPTPTAFNPVISDSLPGGTALARFRCACVRWVKGEKNTNRDTARRFPRPAGSARAGCSYGSQLNRHGRGPRGPCTALEFIPCMRHSAAPDREQGQSRTRRTDGSLSGVIDDRPQAAERTGAVGPAQRGTVAPPREPRRGGRARSARSPTTGRSRVRGRCRSQPRP